MSTRGTAATTCKIPLASSSPDRSGASSALQARVAAPFRHRTHHRAQEDRRSPRPLLSQRPRRRRRQRHPLRRRLKLPPHPRLIQRTLGPVPGAAIAITRLSTQAQSGFLTATMDDRIARIATLDKHLQPRAAAYALHRPARVHSFPACKKQVYWLA
jgi:hypothetical protein